MRVAPRSWVNMSMLPGAAVPTTLIESAFGFGGWKLGLVLVSMVPPLTSSSMVSRRRTRPWAPASTTPASRRTASWEGVLARAMLAAVVAAVSTSISESVGAWFAAMAAARRTVTTVPSTGSIMAWWTNLLAVVSACCTVRPVMRSETADWASPRRTWLSTMPELPRAPFTAPTAMAAVSLVMSRWCDAGRSLTSARAASMVWAMFEPVSASGTGKTLSLLISARRATSSATARVSHLCNARPSRYSTFTIEK